MRMKMRKKRKMMMKKKRKKRKRYQHGNINKDPTVVGSLLIKYFINLYFNTLPYFKSIIFFNFEIPLFNSLTVYINSSLINKFLGPRNRGYYASYNHSRNQSQSS